MKLKKIFSKKHKIVPNDQIMVEFRPNIFSRALVAKCDIGPLTRLCKDLDDWGLRYHFSSNIYDWMKLEEKNVIDGEKIKRKEYFFEVWSVNETKALKSPAYWNSITKFKHQIDDSTASCGTATVQSGEATSRMLDQLSLMWGYSRIKREDLLTDPIFQGKEIYTRYEFGLVENGATHGTEPIIIFKNTII